jgi:carbamoyltransferase|tara:strand:- start:10307 stop:12142 length:1836 start_codon:yes stop_codon:yes gene_type:complete
LSYIIGISAFYHDSAASIIKNGEILASAQEERFTRKKHDPSFPKNSINFCLDFCKINLSDVDAVVFYEKPFVKFERLLETYIAFFPWGLKSFIASFPVWIKEKLFQKKLIFEALKSIDKKFDIKKLKFSEHHLSHSASAFFSSPFKEASILTLDGVGEWTTSSVASGDENKIEIQKEMHFPHSLGLLYSAFTYYLGFRVNSGEYKVMGLAPYGEPIYTKRIKDSILDLKEDGSFILDQSYFNYATGLEMTSKKFENLFEKKTRIPSDKLEQFHMDVAASIQKITEEIVIKICQNIHNEQKQDNLCLSGGVALNCVANGQILKNTSFKKIWVQPASGDAGNALGAALAYWHIGLGEKREIKEEDSMKGSYLGTEYSNDQIEEELKKCNAVFRKYEKSEIINLTAKDLSDSKSIGWFQGRMEFGPRALGNRSILADPRDKNTQEKLNLKIKFRESFRPFAPAILEEYLSDYYEDNVSSPYMLLVNYLKKSRRYNVDKNELKNKFGIEKLKIERSEIPSVTHLDYSARVQTVNEKNNKLFYDLLKEFNRLTNCPVLINTSFNIRGEPIVESIKDAFNCFMGTNLDILVCGNYYLEKNKQVVKKNFDYQEEFLLD